MKRKLACIHTPWKRLFLDAYLSALIVVGALQTRPAGAHWIGRDRRRRRLEVKLFAVLVVSALAVLEPQEFILWSAIGGGGISIFLVLYLLCRFVSRKRWTRQAPRYGRNGP